jgi:hypothetical protein
MTIKRIFKKAKKREAFHRYLLKLWIQKRLANLQNATSTTSTTSTSSTTTSAAATTTVVLTTTTVGLTTTSVTTTTGSQLGGLIETAANKCPSSFAEVITFIFAFSLKCELWDCILQHWLVKRNHWWKNWDLQTIP